MYDNPNLPYRCPLCFQSVSNCLWDSTGKRKACGCTTCNCNAPMFEQKFGESIFMPEIKWNNWVIKYRNEHPDYHKDYLCKKCLRDRKDCKYYNSELINCPDALYEVENEAG